MRGLAAMSGPKCTVLALLFLAPAIALSSRLPEPTNAKYLGSRSCQRCHQEAFASWERALHIRMTRDAEPAGILGDFRNGTRFARYGRSYELSSRDGRHFVTVTRPGQDPERYEVHYTLGARRFQGYLSRLPDGRIYVLPAFWHVETSQWIDFKEITPLPDSDHDFRQIWNVNCFNCHATNLAQNFDPAMLTYNTTWTEMGVGCEACHGPGADHVALMNEWERTPSARPAYDSSSANRKLGAILKIFTTRTASAREVFDTCGYCHGNKVNYFPGFEAGDRYEDYALPFLVSEPIPSHDPQGDFWPDGRPNRFNRPQALTSSGCFQKGQLTCTDCHVVHGARFDHALKLPLERSNGLCTPCHREFEAAAALTAHSRHPAASPGSRCVDCHMSEVNWRLLNRRRDHTFAPPVPELTARFGTPDACTTCHDDRPPEWAVRVMDKWYGPRDRDRRARAVARAEAMYRGAISDPAALPALAKTLGERPAGMVVRASAAEFMGRLIAASATKPLPQSAYTSAVDALMRASTDTEAVVRASALRALVMSRDPRVVPVVSARLRDAARVVRVIAAAGLQEMGVPALKGPAQVAFAEAQREYEQSLRAFPDIASNQVALGILLARQGKYDLAIREWEQGRRLDPADPRFERLIAAARQRQ